MASPSTTPDYFSQTVPPPQLSSRSHHSHEQQSHRQQHQHLQRALGISGQDVVSQPQDNNINNTIIFKTEQRQQLPLQQQQQQQQQQQDPSQYHDSNDVTGRSDTTDHSMRHHQDAQNLVAASSSPFPGMDLLGGGDPHTPYHHQGSSHNTNHLSSQLSNHFVGSGDSAAAAAAAAAAAIAYTGGPMPPPPTTPSLGNSLSTPIQGSGSRKRKAGAMGATGDDADAELRRIAQNNVHTPLEELAKRVQEDESGTQAEKSRQLFGMTWLLKNCEMSVDAAVPRNRIYARYVGNCSEFNLKQLNPASFGKLVRLIYPGIKTRRLGVRGQSKYHYCGIRLIGELNNPTGDTPAGTPGRFGNSPDNASLIKSGFHLSNAGDQHQTHQFATYIPPSPYSTPGSHGRFMRTVTTPGSEYDPKLIGNRALEEFSSSGNGSPDSRQVNSIQLNQTSVSSSSPDDELRFAAASFNDIPEVPLTRNSRDSFTIPAIDSYLPRSTDPDSSATLYALYKSYCRSLIEALRFMHLKKFLGILNGFVGGLTAPIQKLLKEPSVSVWISKVDWITYQEMVRILSPLVLQEIPTPVLTCLRSLTQYLTPQLNAALVNMPEHLVQAKLKPAHAFTNLLERLFRANESALTAGRILVNPAEIQKMKYDWSRLINSKAIVHRELACASEDVQKILDEDIVQLLSGAEYSGGDLFDISNFTGGKDESKNVDEDEDSLNDKIHNNNNNSNNMIEGGDQSNTTPNGREGSGEHRGGIEQQQDSALILAQKTEVIIVRWAHYMAGLPLRFPQIRTRLFLLCMTSVLTAALRDISMGGGESFGAWWIVRCWVDEWMGWSAEMRSFLAEDQEGAANALTADFTPLEESDRSQSQVQDSRESDTRIGNGELRDDSNILDDSFLSGGNIVDKKNGQGKSSSGSHVDDGSQGSLGEEVDDNLGANVLEDVETANLNLITDNHTGGVIQQDIINEDDQA